MGLVAQCKYCGFQASFARLPDQVRCDCQRCLGVRASWFCGSGCENAYAEEKAKILELEKARL